MARKKNSAPEIRRMKVRKTHYATLRICGERLLLGPFDDPASHIRGRQIIDLYLAWGQPRYFTEERRLQVEQIRTSQGVLPPAAPALPPSQPQAASGQLAAPDPMQMMALMAQQMAAQMVAQMTPQQPIQSPLAELEPQAEITDASVVDVTPEPAPLTVGDLVDQYLPHAKNEYQRESTYHDQRRVLEKLKTEKGQLPIDLFGPAELGKFRDTLIAESKARLGKAPTAKHINKCMHIVKHMFGWAAGEVELITEAQASRVERLKQLKAGQYGVRASEEVKDIDPAIVERTLPWLPPGVRDMIRLQLYTGARPIELQKLTPSMIERGHMVTIVKTDDEGRRYEEQVEIWKFTLGDHKTKHHGKKRVIALGPQAQEILEPYLDRPKTHLCFTPRENKIAAVRAYRAGVKAKLQGLELAQLGRPDRGRKGGEKWTKDTYRQTVVRRIEEANEVLPPEEQIPHWHPYQLRHTFGTQARLESGDAVAVSAAMGHASLQTTAIYDHTNWQNSQQIAAQVG